MWPLKERNILSNGDDKQSLGLLRINFSLHEKTLFENKASIKSTTVSWKEANNII